MPKWQKRLRYFICIVGVVMVLVSGLWIFGAVRDARTQDAAMAAGSRELEEFKSAISTTTSTTTTTTRPTTTTTTTTTTTLPPTTTTTIVFPTPPGSIPTNDVFGWIDIPDIDLIGMQILEGDAADRQYKALTMGVSHWPGTSYPGGGGNAVFGGHRTSRDAPFNRLNELEVGDIYTLTTGYGTYTYSVYRVIPEVVADSQMFKDIYASNQTDRPRETSTLYSCKLPGDGGTDFRVVVMADLVAINGIDITQ